jgi:tripartite-type tricarboxylate transporter receptor subunit TctC
MPGSGCPRFRTTFPAVLAFVGALAASISITVAQEIKTSYLGKQIRMVIANSPGGSYDIYARVLGQHLSRHIPGSPTIINQNMPTASGMQATNWTYSSAPKDGSVILATYNSLLAEPLYGNSAVRYDVLKFKFVGSISKQQNVCATWHTNPVKTIAQAREREVIVTANGTTSDSYILPKILNAMLGTKFKTITGYATAEARLAVERGEADGVCGLSWSTLKTSNTEWVQKKLLNLLLQTGAKRQTDLPDVPLVIEVISNPDDRRAFELLSFQQEMGRPFLMPPGTPDELVTIMRRAFEETLKDTQFLADAERALLEVDPITGTAMEQILRDAYALPKALRQRAAELHGGPAN